MFISPFHVSTHQYCCLPDPQGAVIKHSCPPYALAWCADSIIAAGCDRRVQFYTHRGKVRYGLVLLKL